MGIKCSTVSMGALGRGGGIWQLPRVQKGGASFSIKISVIMKLNTVARKNVLAGLPQF